MADTSNFTSRAQAAASWSMEEMGMADTARPPDGEGVLPGTFAAWYEANLKRAVAHAYLRTGNFADAEDITQDTFTELLGQWPELERVSDQRRRARLFKVLRWRCIDYFRSQDLSRERTRQLAREPDQVVVRADDEALNKIMASGQQVLEALNRLSKRERAVFFLIEVEGMKNVEVAGLLDISASAIGTSLMRANRKMATYRQSRNQMDGGDS